MREGVRGREKVEGGKGEGREGVGREEGRETCVYRN